MRYGRTMQAISGVHFNYSFSARIVGCARAHQPIETAAPGLRFRAIFRRPAEITGASAGWCCICSALRPRYPRGFLPDATSALPSLDADTVYEPYGTSLRMSDIGYRNKNQATVSVSVNGLDEYVRDLSQRSARPTRRTRSSA